VVGAQPTRTSGEFGKPQHLMDASREIRHRIVLLLIPVGPYFDIPSDRYHGAILTRDSYCVLNHGG
jgi:hypothetical protein